MRACNTPAIGMLGRQPDQYIDLALLMWLGGVNRRDRHERVGWVMRRGRRSNRVCRRTGRVRLASTTAGSSAASCICCDQGADGRIARPDMGRPRRSITAAIGGARRGAGISFSRAWLRLGISSASSASTEPHQGLPLGDRVKKGDAAQAIGSRQCLDHLVDGSARSTLWPTLKASWSPLS